jgi:hypothetical protein
MDGSELVELTLLFSGVSPLETRWGREGIQKRGHGRGFMTDRLLWRRKVKRRFVGLKVANGWVLKLI